MFCNGMLIYIFVGSVEVSPKQQIRRFEMENKEDRRVMMTKRMLKEAMTELLRENDIYHISIRELCERADVNRTTFYKYYGSQFDLLTEMESDIISLINNTITKNNVDIDATIKVLCEYLNDNLEFARLLINNNIDPGFAGKLFSLSVIRDSVAENYRDKYDGSEMEYVYNYITYGAFRIICMWLSRDEREAPEKLAAMIRKLTGCPI